MSPHGVVKRCHHAKEMKPCVHLRTEGGSVTEVNVAYLAGMQGRPANLNADPRSHLVWNWANGYLECDINFANSGIHMAPFSSWCRQFLRQSSSSQLCFFLRSVDVSNVSSLGNVGVTMLCQMLAQLNSENTSKLVRVDVSGTRITCSRPLLPLLH
jgi:hypothetical protein